MTNAGTWYPPTFLSNPPFTMEPTTPAALTETLAERGQRYGEFKGHAEITQALKRLIMLHTPATRTLPDGRTERFLAADQQEALDMICHNIGYIINGDPNYADSWIDIAHYAWLVADRLNGVER